MKAQTGVWHILATITLYCLSGGLCSRAAIGQGVSADAASQLDSGFGSVLTTGTLRYANGQTVTGLAQLSYTAQASATYSSLVQAVDLTSFSVNGSGAAPFTSPAPKARLLWTQSSEQANQGTGSFAALHPIYGSTSGPMLTSSGTGDDSFSPVTVAPGSFRSTSCLDLAAGCEALTATAPAAAPRTMARVTGATIAARKTGAKARYGTPVHPTAPNAKAKVKKVPGTINSF